MGGCFLSVNVNPRTWLVKLTLARVNPKSASRAGFVLPINFKRHAFFHALSKESDVLTAARKLPFPVHQLVNVKRAVFAPHQDLIRNRQAMISAARGSGPIIHMMIPANPFKQTPDGQSRAESADIWRARRFIEQNCGEEISLTKLANAVNISPTHLSEKFKQVTGVRFVDYVAHTRFDKAPNFWQMAILGSARSRSRSGFNPSPNSIAFLKDSPGNHR